LGIRQDASTPPRLISCRLAQVLHDRSFKPTEKTKAKDVACAI
jgi:hypothetical protein